LEAALADVLEGTPFSAWLPAVDLALEPLSPGGELLAVALGLLIPCLLGFCIMRHMGRRMLLALSALAVGVAATALSALLSYGPAHAWEWLTPATAIGLGVGLAAALGLATLPRRGCAAVLLLVLMLHLNLLNQAPTNAYFAQTLQAWEQGRFIRFYGLGQWLGWLWPYAALLYVLLRVSRRDVQS
ncbi:MAG: VanZ family protein, partial [Alicycliphilus sp.]|nr:VanZ family protein [Alicycliphilus sp.]